MRSGTGIRVGMLLGALAVIYAAGAFGESLPVQAKVKADLLRVRESPTLDADVVGKLPSGSDVTVLERAPNGAPWLKVKIPNTDTTGWVHSDYVAFAAEVGKQAAKAASVRFVRASVWKGDPRKEWLATPGDPEDGRFYGVHGAFPAGTKLSVLAQGETKAFQAVAKQTIQVENSAGGTFAVTELSFASDDHRGKRFFLAIVGAAPKYEAIEKRPVTDASQLVAIPKRAEAVPDFQRLPYDYPESGFSASDTKAAAYTMTIAGTPATLATFTTPFKDQAANPGGRCETAVLLWSGKPLICSGDGGSGAWFFRLGDKEYCWCDFESCSNGVRMVELFERGKAAFNSIYTNDDFGS